MNQNKRFLVVRGETLIDTFEDKAQAEKYLRDWPDSGLQIVER